MKVVVDREKLEEGHYDEKGFAVCECGKHRYPSKKMLIDFLKSIQKLSGRPVADIWSSTDLNTGETTISLEIKYKALNKK